MSQPKKPLDKSITAEEIEVLNTCLNRTHAVNFNSFLSQPATSGLSYIEYLKYLLGISKYQPSNTDIKINLTEGEQMQIVIDFFHSLRPDIGVQVEEIFSKKQNTYDVNFITDPNDKMFGKSFVQESSKKERLQFNVSFTNDVSSMIILAHELSHAISSRTLLSYELLKNYRESQDNFEEFAVFHSIEMQPNVDCITEVESHITELLFLEFLVRNNIITQEQSKEFIKKRKTSFRNDLINIITEFEAVQHLGFPVTDENFSKFATWSEKHKPYLQERIRRKIEQEQAEENNGNFAKYKFRYVIAEIISTVWYEKFQCATTVEKRKMVKKFITFLQKNAIMDMETTIKNLLDMSTEELGKQFYNLQTKRNEQNFEF